MAASPFSTAERAASHIPPLLLAAERVASTILQGSHGRRRAGPGETFWQFRPYTVGDSLRAIDWRQTAKSPHTQVRDREWMAAQTIALWADDRPAMDWCSHPSLPTKAERATLLALALAIILSRSGERAGWVSPPSPNTGPDAAFPQAGPWFSGQHAAARLAEQREHHSVHRTPLSARGIRDSGIPPRSTVVCFTDALDPPEVLEKALRSLCPRTSHRPGAPSRGHLVQVLDPAEERFPYQGRMVFTAPTGSGGTSSGVPAPADDPAARPWLVPRAEDIAQAYHRRFSAQRDAVRAIARRLGWHVTVHHTDQPPHTALLALYHHLAGDW